MPRGKVSSVSFSSTASSSELSITEHDENNNVSKFTLIKPAAKTTLETKPLNTPKLKNFAFPRKEAIQSSDTPEVVKAADSAPNHSLNFKFTLLLVSLFVAVNIGLAILLNDSKPQTQLAVTKPVPPVVETKSAPRPVLELKAQPAKPLLELANKKTDNSVSAAEQNKINQQDLLSILSRD